MVSRTRDCDDRVRDLRTTCRSICRMTCGSQRAGAGGGGIYGAGDCWSPGSRYPLRLTDVGGRPRAPLSMDDIRCLSFIRHYAGLRCGLRVPSSRSRATAPRRDQYPYQSSRTNDDTLGYVRDYLDSPGSSGILAGHDACRRTNGLNALSSALLRTRLGGWSLIKRRAPGHGCG